MVVVVELLRIYAWVLLLLLLKQRDLVDNVQDILQGSDVFFTHFLISSAQINSKPRANDDLVRGLSDLSNVWRDDNDPLTCGLGRLLVHSQLNVVLLGHLLEV